MSKEEISAEQIRRLFSALGRSVKQIQPQPQASHRPDVLVVEISGRKIAIETTDFHSDEHRDGGSALRRQGKQHATAEGVWGAAVPLNPLPGLLLRINEKVSKKYDLTGADECWLVICANVPQDSASVVATSFFPGVLDCQRLQELTIQTTPALHHSKFDECHL